MAMQPKLIGIEQISAGWINKYVLTYERADGSPYRYECASRKKMEAFRAGLERRGALSMKHALDDGRLEAAAPDGAMPEAAALGEAIPTMETPDGTTATAETAVKPGDASPTAEPPDAVCIVARTPRDTLVMIREFRYPLNSWCIAFPAGLVDAGEDLIACASRELEEETGYSLVEGGATRALPQAGFSSTGMSDETVHVVFVEAERTSEPHREQNELIEVFELPVGEVRAFLDENELPIGTRAQLVLEMFAATR